MSQESYDLYYNGKPVNPNRDLPHMTLSQAEACGLTNSNRLWIRTDGTGENIPIVDNLTTESATSALSAKQGRILNIPKLVWSGNAYTIGDEIQLTSFDSNKEYLFGFKPFTNGDGIMFMPTILTNHTFLQFTFWGNSQQHAAYRLTHSGNGKFVIAQDTLGNVPGCALVEIYERN